MRDKATVSDIIAEVIANLHENAEPLSKTVLPPSIFHIYLHQDDYARLQPLFPRLQKEVAEALDEEVKLHNSRVKALSHPLKAAFTKLPELVKGVIGQKNIERPMPYEEPKTGWQISFNPAPDDDHKRGDIGVLSELALAQSPELGGGRATMVLKTVRRDGGSRVISERKASLSSAAPSDEYATFASASSKASSKPAGEPVKVYARISYRDNAGARVYEMAKNLIVIGRGGTGYWVDLRLDTPPDVSREHIRLRRDETTGQFYLKDLSALGTTINGAAVESSLDKTGDRRVDKNIETPLPARARIGLAGVIELEFEAV